MDDKEQLLKLLVDQCGEHSPVVLHRSTNSRSPGETIQITYDEQITLGRPLEKQIGAEEYVRALVVIWLTKTLGYSPEQLILEYEVPVHVGHHAGPKYADIAILRPKGVVSSVYCLIELKSPSRLMPEWDNAWKGQLWGLAAFVAPSPSYLGYGSIRMSDGSVEMFVADAQLHNNYSSWQKDGAPRTGELPSHETQLSAATSTDSEMPASSPRASFFKRALKRLAGAANEIMHIPSGRWVKTERGWRIRITFRYNEDAQNCSKGDTIDVRVHRKNKPSTTEKVRLTSQVSREGSRLTAWGVKVHNPDD